MMNLKKEGKEGEEEEKVVHKLKGKRKEGRKWLGRAVGWLKEK